MSSAESSHDSGRDTSYASAESLKKEIPPIAASLSVLAVCLKELMGSKSFVSSNDLLVKQLVNNLVESLRSLVQYANEVCIFSVLFFPLDHFLDAC